MEVHKIADIVNGILRLRDGLPYGGEIIGYLVSLDGLQESDSNSHWTLEIGLGNRPPLRLALPILVSPRAPVSEPQFLPYRQFIYFCGSLFMAESPPRTAEQCTQIVDEVKKRARGESVEPEDPIPRPPGVPEGHINTWIDPSVAADLIKRYAGTDAVWAACGDVEPLLKRKPQTSKREAVSVDALLYELDKLTGLTAVKRDLRSLVNYLRVQQLRKEAGLPTAQMTMHLVFTGNPGTGKTTVARLLAQIYKAMGFLPEGQLIEIDRSGLVGEYLGHTAVKTLQVIRKAIGGVLFIDEAYALSRNVHGQKDMFGLEAIDTLLKGMEDNRDKLVVIVAGYPKEMKEFVASNPGLRSRFTRYIDFPDYAPQELVQIFEHQASETGYLLTENARKRVAALFKTAYENRDEGFGNGRWVRTIFERASVNLSDRLSGERNITREHLMTIEEADIESMKQ